MFDRQYAGASDWRFGNFYQEMQNFIRYCAASGHTIVGIGP